MPSICHVAFKVSARIQFVEDLAQGDVREDRSFTVDDVEHFRVDDLRILGEYESHGDDEGPHESELAVDEQLVPFAPVVLDPVDGLLEGVALDRLVHSRLHVYLDVRHSVLFFRLGQLQFVGHAQQVRELEDLGGGRGYFVSDVQGADDVMVVGYGTQADGQVLPGARSHLECPVRGRLLRRVLPFRIVLHLGAVRELEASRTGNYAHFAVHVQIQYSVRTSVGQFHGVELFFRVVAVLLVRPDLHFQLARVQPLVHFNHRPKYHIFHRANPGGRRHFR